MDISSSSPTISSTETSKVSQQPTKHDFNPYDNNGGTCLAIAGDDWVVAAGDTRLSTGFAILSRNCSRMIQLTPHCVLTTSGMQSDIKTLHKDLKARLTWYQHQHGGYPSTPAIAQMLSTMLYGRRTFPYYTFNILAGLDSNGKGGVYSYDAVGSYERSTHACQGSGQPLIQPLLDNRMTLKHQQFENDEQKPKYSAKDITEFAKIAFTAAAERDIYTGDSAEIYVFQNKKKLIKEQVELRKD